MDTDDFGFEFYSTVPDPAGSLREEARRRLSALAEGYTDMIGASVAIEELTQEETPHVYEARVVAYLRPDNIAAVEKSDSAIGALKGALDAAERQVRELRDKLSEPWKRADLPPKPVPGAEASPADAGQSKAADVSPSLDG